MQNADADADADAQVKSREPKPKKHPALFLSRSLRLERNAEAGKGMDGF